jgi:hypothetical protein
MNVAVKPETRACDTLRGSRKQGAGEATSKREAWSWSVVHGSERLTRSQSREVPRRAITGCSAHMHALVGEL